MASSGLQPADSLQKVRPADPCRPHLDVRRDDFPHAGMHPFPVDLGHPGGAEEEPEAPAMPVRAVPDFVEIGIERAGRDLM